MYIYFFGQLPFNMQECTVSWLLLHNKPLWGDSGHLVGIDLVIKTGWLCIIFHSCCNLLTHGGDTQHCGSNHNHFILYQSEHGTIIKALSTTNKSLRGCYLEEMNILPEGAREPILNLQILQSDRSLFVGLHSRVLKIPLERCSNYKSQEWVTLLKGCTSTRVLINSLSGKVEERVSDYVNDRLYSVSMCSAQPRWIWSLHCYRFHTLYWVQGSKADSHSFACIQAYLKWVFVMMYFVKTTCSSFSLFS